MPEKRPTKSYKLTPEALDAIDALDEKIEDKLKSKIVSEAIIQYALAHGIKVKGRDKSETLKSLSKKSKRLEKTVAALCRSAYAYECDLDKQEKKIKQVLAKAVRSGTSRNVEALWGVVEEDLPECMQSQGKDFFMIYVEGYGIPRKKAAKVRKK